jgi:hypothetical protein
MGKDGANRMYNPGHFMRLSLVMAAFLLGAYALVLSAPEMDGGPDLTALSATGIEGSGATPIPDSGTRAVGIADVQLTPANDYASDFGDK